MQYSTNYNMNKPELAEQYRLTHWNENTDIIDGAMQAIRSGTDEVMKATLLNFCYPIGSLYWSSKDTDPSTLFGGTWVQIKDRFVLACGDTYKTVGATGGASTVTLSVSNMPSHNHSFTPSGNVSEHSHGLNSHTHSFGGSGTTGNESAHENFNWSGTHNHSIITNTNNSYWSDTVGGQDINAGGIVFSGKKDAVSKSSYQVGNKNYTTIIDYKNIEVKGTCTGDHTHSFSYSGTTGGASGNTASATPTFTGNAGTTSSNGSGTSFSILPPYVVKYCWERTA